LLLKKSKEEDQWMHNNKACESSHRELRKKWDHPHLVIYGDMTALTQASCKPNVPGCKPKVMGLGDDFSNNISTLE
jgi:hypothetical protein